MWLPCGKCIGCKLVKARSWAIRAVHEAQMHEDNCFITLTYNPDTYEPGLNYSHFQLFMRRLRKKKGKTRFLMCGEYGEENLRPHFHALLFGQTFKNDGPVSEYCYRSKELEELWPHGISSWGAVTYQSAGYVARYSLKKITGDKADAHYQRIDIRTGELVQVVPEFARMSLKPGIGHEWFKRYWKEVYEARDGIVQPGGRLIPPPRYYDKLLEETDNELKDQKDYERYVRSKQFADDTTPSRLAVREKCAAAKAAFLRRPI